VTYLQYTKIDVSQIYWEESGKYRQEFVVGPTKLDDISEKVPRSATDRRL